MNRRLTHAQLRHLAATEEGRAAAESLRYRYQGNTSKTPPTPDMIRAVAWLLAWANRERAFDDALLEALGLEWTHHESGAITLELIVKPREPTP